MDGWNKMSLVTSLIRHPVALSLGRFWYNVAESGGYLWNRKEQKHAECFQISIHICIVNTVSYLKKLEESNKKNKKTFAFKMETICVCMYLPPADVEG